MAKVIEKLELEVCVNQEHLDSLKSQIVQAQQKLSEAVAIIQALDLDTKQLIDLNVKEI